MKKQALILLFVSIIITTRAQKTTLPTGGIAIGTTGNVSYSIGQIFYTTTNGSDGSSAQGVQQPYEISVILGLNVTQVELTINAFPNPTIDFLTLKVDEIEHSELHYQLIDISGKTLINQRITAPISKINLTQISPTTLILVVIRDGKIVKTFKIIKK
ncbi:MAG: T9SS type A sorting domain-containing protein [Bacteroidales bacterium]|nr:T9SS type A sorting domain-containing protein [Bacteroidales bacterium]